ELRLHRFEIGPRLVHRYAGLETPDRDVPAPFSMLRGRGVGWNRHPDFRIAVRKREGSGQDADDRPGMLMNSQLFCEHVRIGAKAAAPQAVADENCIRPAELFFGGIELASHRRCDAEYLEKSALFAPIPRASVRMTTIEKDGDLRIKRTAPWKFFSVASRMGKRCTSRNSSLICSAPPNSSAARLLASSGVMPRAMFSSVSFSMWK